MIGQTLSHYRIQERLGEGAAGTVYKAENLFNNTVVAIKILHADCLKDESRHERFLREAKAAGLVDHRSIGQVFDYQEVEGHAFQVMRFYEGGNLQDRLRLRPTPLPEAVLIAIQIAEGLEAVHQHGIIHRDIKPSNLMIARREASCDGLDGDKGASSRSLASTVDLAETNPNIIEEIKITDFGVALFPDSTRLTDTGGRVGTPAYMAPEQIRGDTPDERTDLWSLGGVLYEMVTGSPPFQAERYEALMYAVQHRDPTPIPELCPEAPAQLTWIINKALKKEPDDRYSNATEMLGDLRSVYELLRGKKKKRRDTWIIENRGRLLFAGFGLLAVAAAIVLGPVIFPGSGDSLHELGQPVKLTASSNWVGNPIISPDGTRVAFASRVDGNQDIYLVSSLGGEPLQLTKHPADDNDPTWFPDGSGLLFTSNRSGDAAVWKISQTGGDALMLVADAHDPAVSSDGQQVAFCRTDEVGDNRVFIAPVADPHAARQLTHSGDGPGSHHSPAWSPDGERICYGTMHELWTVEVASSRAEKLTRDGGYNSDPAWSPGGKRVYYTSWHETTIAISWVDVGSGRSHSLTPGSGPERHPSVSRDGARLAYTTQTEDEDIVIWNRTTGGEVCIDGVQDDYQATLSPDGNWLAYVSRRWGKQNDLWLQRLQDGKPHGKPVRLTDQPGRAAHPAFSPDGRWLAYYRIQGDERDLWTVPVAGGQPRRLTSHPGDDVHPSWSPDGSRIAFVSEREGVSSVWTLPVDDGMRAGEPQRVTAGGVTALYPEWSPDGGWIAFIGFQDKHLDVWLVPADGSAPARRLTAGIGAQRVRWDHASGELWVSGSWGGDQLCLRRVETTDGSDHPLEPPFLFHQDSDYALFDLGPRGDTVVFSRPNLGGNIWYLEAEDGVY